MLLPKIKTESGRRGNLAQNTRHNVSLHSWGSGDMFALPPKFVGVSSIFEKSCWRNLSSLYVVLKEQVWQSVLQVLTLIAAFMFNRNNFPQNLLRFSYCFSGRLTLLFCHVRLLHSRAGLKMPGDWPDFVPFDRLVFFWGGDFLKRKHSTMHNLYEWRGLGHVFSLFARRFWKQLTTYKKYLQLSSTIWLGNL